MSAVLVVSSQQSWRRYDILLAPRGDTDLHAGLPIGKAKFPMKNHAVVLNNTKVAAKGLKTGIRFSAEKVTFLPFTVHHRGTILPTQNSGRPAKRGTRSQLHCWIATEEAARSAVCPASTALRGDCWPYSGHQRLDAIGSSLLRYWFKNLPVQ